MHANTAISPTVDAPAAASLRNVTRVVRGRPTSDGAGVKLTRVIGQPALDMLDPFLMLDEFRSDQASDYIAGFPEHPHRGFETVTYMLAGRMRHGDNQGNSGLLTAGSVQWMTAGRGILHSEMPEQEDGLMWGFQLWVNLPAKDKMTAPRYQDIAPERIPEIELATGVSARVIAGEAGGVKGPVEADATAAVYLDLRLEAGATVEVPLPQGHNAFAYVYAGQARIGDGPTGELLTFNGVSRTYNNLGQLTRMTKSGVMEGLSRWVIAPTTTQSRAGSGGGRRLLTWRHRERNKYVRGPDREWVQCRF